ncbi:MAG: molecular chaperone DnaJ [Bacteroidales bacterium]
MDLYAVLGIKPTASPDEIKRAYRRLARRYHPDINPGDPAAEQRYQQISLAYETLIDPGRRRRYDENGVAAESASPGTVGFEGFDFSVAVEGPRASTFGDLFADVIQRGLARPAERSDRGSDLHATLEVPFEDAVKGTERRATVTRLTTCRGCAGTGTVQTSEAPCLYCGGTGALRAARGHMVFTRTCERCAGTGRQRRATCGRCGGRGVETHAEAVTVPVPRGAYDEMEVRVPGKGNCGSGGGPCGDLIVTLRVEPHPLFRRHDDDLWLQVPVAVHEAALGTRIDIPTLEGAARLRVPPGTQSGHRFRLRERGVPSPRDGRRGDLIVEIRIVLPPLLDERSKELLREFARINPEDVRADWIKGPKSEG